MTGSDDEYIHIKIKGPPSDARDMEAGPGGPLSDVDMDPDKIREKATLLGVPATTLIRIESLASRMDSTIIDR